MATAAAAAAWALLFLKRQWQFSYSVYPPWAAVERNPPERAVMTISNNNGSGRSEVYNWINSGLLTYKQVKLMLNQHLEPHLSTQHNKKSNQKKLSAWCWWDLMVELHRETLQKHPRNFSEPPNYLFHMKQATVPSFSSQISFSHQLTEEILDLRGHAALQPQLCRVICSDVNKYDKHLSWSDTQWKTGAIWYQKTYFSWSQETRKLHFWQMRRGGILEVPLGVQ